MHLSSGTFFKLKRHYILILMAMALFGAATAQVRTPPGWYHDPQPQSKLRWILSKIHLEVTPGFNITNYAHDADGFALYSGTEGTRLFLPSDYNSGTNSINSSLTTWFNQSLAEGAFNLTSGDYIVSSDTVVLKLKQRTRGIPISLTAFVRIDRFRVGAGYLIQPEIIRSFQVQNFPSPDIMYDPGVGFIWLRKYYGMVGGDIIRFGTWVMSADLRVGGWNPGKKFNRAQIDKGLFFNLGAGFEWDKAEYFKIFARPSFELKRYTLNIPETSGTMRHRTNNFTLQFGAIVRLPEKPKCPIKKCQVQKDHLHGDREYRSRMFPIWKWQDPNYGQNYPQLIKYKRKSRNKKNPY